MNALDRCAVRKSISLCKPRLPSAFSGSTFVCLSRGYVPRVNHTFCNSSVKQGYQRVLLGLRFCAAVSPVRAACPCRHLSSSGRGECNDRLGDARRSRFADEEPLRRLELGLFNDILEKEKAVERALHDFCQACSICDKKNTESQSSGSYVQRQLQNVMKKAEIAMRSSVQHQHPREAWEVFYALNGAGLFSPGTPWASDSALSSSVLNLAAKAIEMVPLRRRQEYLLKRFVAAEPDSLEVSVDNTKCNVFAPSQPCLTRQYNNSSDEDSKVLSRNWNDAWIEDPLKLAAAEHFRHNLFLLEQMVSQSGLMNSPVALVMYIEKMLSILNEGGKLCTNKGEGKERNFNPSLKEAVELFSIRRLSFAVLWHPETFSILNSDLKYTELTPEELRCRTKSVTGLFGSQLTSDHASVRSILSILFPAEGWKEHFPNQSPSPMDTASQLYPVNNSVSEPPSPFYQFLSAASSLWAEWDALLVKRLLDNLLLPSAVHSTCRAFEQMLESFSCFLFPRLEDCAVGSNAEAKVKSDTAFRWASRTFTASTENTGAATETSSFPTAAHARLDWILRRRRFLNIIVPDVPFLMRHTRQLWELGRHREIVITHSVLLELLHIADGGEVRIFGSASHPSESDQCWWASRGQASTGTCSPTRFAARRLLCELLSRSISNEVSLLHGDLDLPLPSTSSHNPRVLSETSFAYHPLLHRYPIRTQGRNCLMGKRFMEPRMGLQSREAATPKERRDEPKRRRAKTTDPVSFVALDRRFGGTSSSPSTFASPLQSERGMLHSNGLSQSGQSLWTRRGAHVHDTNAYMELLGRALHRYRRGVPRRKPNGSDSQYQLLNQVFCYHVREREKRYKDSTGGILNRFRHSLSSFSSSPSAFQKTWRRDTIKRSWSVAPSASSWRSGGVTLLGLLEELTLRSFADDDRLVGQLLPPILRELSAASPLQNTSNGSSRLCTSYSAIACARGVERVLSGSVRMPNSSISSQNLQKESLYGVQNSRKRTPGAKGSEHLEGTSSLKKSNKMTGKLENSMNATEDEIDRLLDGVFANPTLHTPATTPRNAKKVRKTPNVKCDATFTNCNERSEAPLRPSASLKSRQQSYWARMPVLLATPDPETRVTAFLLGASLYPPTNGFY